MDAWYQTNPQETLNKLKVKEGVGLSDHEVSERQKKFGNNSLHAIKKINPLKLFFSQFNDVLIIVLLISAGISFALAFVDQNGSIKESLLIFVIVIAIALVGFFNEYKAEKTIEALKKLVSFKVRVRRNNMIVEVDSGDIVPGDIVLLEEGQKVTADIRILQSNSLQANESSLTGESLPSSKNNQTIKSEVVLGDQKCMLFAGTYLTAGSGVGVVVETAQKTEIGKIAEMVGNIDEQDTPMQKKLDALGKKLGFFIAIICGLVFVIILLFVGDGADQSFIHRLIFAFTVSVALAVAAIPEGLAFVVRISLALGARRMAGKNALVRKLSAVEALGSTDVICSDKTGTLTKGEMTVRSIFVGGVKGSITGSGYSSEGQVDIELASHEPLEKLFVIGLLCNNANLRNDAIIGDPTEGSLLVSAKKAGVSIEETLSSYTRIKEYPFSSERKKMSTVHSFDGKSFFVAQKGAVEVVLANCSKYLDLGGKTQPLTEPMRNQILATNSGFASDALRVLAFAYKILDKDPGSQEQAESDMVFVGLQAMMDPPRVEVIEVIKRVQSEAGIKVIMITGDFLETAKAIADEIGIVGDAISGVEMDKLSQEEFEKQVEQISVYARVNPEHKIRIVQALKKHGHQVAMTGDGVNDAPAIKAADIGIAMGITGTDVAKEASDLILLDDQFLTIVNAIEEGRGIFDNVRKFVNFLISCNIAEVITVVIGIVLFNDLILTAAQLLFINIVTDGLPAVALGSDPAQRDILKAKPGRFQEAIMSKRIWAEIIIFGTLMSVFLAGQYWYNLMHEGRLSAISAVFSAMVVYELVRLIDIRTDYTIKWFSNPWLSIALLSSFILQILVLYFTPFARYFDVGPLSNHDWSIMLVGSIILVIVMKSLNPLLDKVLHQKEISI